MKATDHIIDIIKREGAVTAKHVAQRLNITTMGARQHLQSLENDGLLHIEDVKVKVGRPNRHWSLTDQGHANFSDRHADLTVQFIDAIETVFGAEGLERVAKERELNTLANYEEQLIGLSDLESKIIKLTELREKDGYMAEYQKDHSSFILIENHCPICKAASRCKALCQSELNVFQSLVGEDTLVERDEHIVSGARRCVYRFTQQ
ncbi:helix-turn-helix transcriptional regulator [Vibrio methylphosphonaticus]|uniref:helix-turn-helix transcriptional regulator n=1 Tax=Vibrio methylphosphonaticus TaxID=2946866 RepID=UPI00202A59D4|nr:metalloregulator ArsR/SmtB family transcription factor [Vibrio methylphosphonaticus]MCL9776392.1 transcriptional regulator [Vibrio methylphosphonaticus]